MKTIDTTAGRVGYLEIGAGRPLLMLHASAGGAGALRRLAEALATDRRIIVPDLDGYGETALHGPADVVERHLRVIALLVGSLELDTYDVFGHSMGGFLALQAASRGLIAPRRLALMEPVAFGTLDGNDAAQAAARAIDRMVTERFEAEAADGRLAAGFSAFIDLWNDTPWSDLPEKVKGKLLTMAPQVLREAPRVSSDETPATAYRNIFCPVLLLQSAAAPLPMATLIPQLAAALPDVRTKVVPRCGHMGPVSAPEAFAALLRDFFRGNMDDRRGEIARTACTPA